LPFEYLGNLYYFGSSRFKKKLAEHQLHVTELIQQKSEKNPQKLVADKISMFLAAHKNACTVRMFIVLDNYEYK